MAAAFCLNIIIGGWGIHACGCKHWHLCVLYQIPLRLYGKECQDVDIGFVMTAVSLPSSQAVIDCNIFPMLNDLLNSGAEYKTRKEAAWAILNATSGGTKQQIRCVAMD